MTNEELLREIEILKQENAQLRALAGWSAGCETFNWKELNQIVSNYEDNGEFTTKLRARIVHCMQQSCRHAFNGEWKKLKRELSRIPAESRESVLNYSCHKSMLTPLEEVFANHSNAEKTTIMVELLLKYGAYATTNILELACVNNVYGAVLLLLHNGASVSEQCLAYSTAPDIYNLLHIQ